MRMALRHSGASHASTKAHLRHGGASKEVERAWIRTGGVTKQFYSSLDSGGATPGVSVSPAFVSGARSSSSSVLVTSRDAAVSVVGGVAPYSYAWTQASGDPMTATSPSGDETAFQASVAPGAVLAGTWTCTVTDAAGTTSSATVNVSLRNLGGTL